MDEFMDYLNDVIKPYQHNSFIKSTTIDLNIKILFQKCITIL